jgi:predicted AAA+ superfamily ATPase
MYNKGVIIDEVQSVPSLFSYIQGHVDKTKIMGEFILTGSQHFLLTQSITQSLAGRTAVLQLLPCALSELPLSNESLYEVLWRGFYPAIYDRQIDPKMFYKSYLNRYVEQDLRSMSMIHDLSKFKTFLQLCAGRVGQIINMTSLGNDTGIDQKTVKAWLSILEMSYIIFFVRPHSKNFNKRLVKQPKLYFYDTGLVSYLLGIENAADTRNHFARGALFENYVAIELIKKRFNDGLESGIYFWRDSNGHEVDFIKESKGCIKPIEVKSSETISTSLFDGLKYWKSLAGVDRGYLVYGGLEAQERSEFTVMPWNKASEL